MYIVHNIRIKKMGNRLGIYFAKNDWNSVKHLKGRYVEIELHKGKKSKRFLTKLNQVISLRGVVGNSLKLRPRDKIRVGIQQIKNMKKPKQVFKHDKVDMASLIPAKTSQGYELIVREFEKNEKKWLRVWYCHERGSAEEIEIRRYIHIITFGNLLGQLQAEGTKSVEKKRKLEFANRLILEHLDYIRALEKCGISKKKIIASFMLKSKKEKHKIKEFEEKTGINIKYITESQQMKGNYAFHTYVRSTVLTEIFLNALDLMRKKLISEKWDSNLEKLGNAFIAKLLTGDGTFDIKIEGREYGFPTTRIKITDCNLQYLKDYAAIMSKLGFQPKILEEHIAVRAQCSLEKLLYLYSIRAFENTNNWDKLIVLIGLNLEGRRLRTYYRFIDLAEVNDFTSLNIAKRYNVVLRSANEWLKNKEKEGLVQKISSHPYPAKWKLTEKGRGLAVTLEVWKRDLDKIVGRRESKELRSVLDSLKLKSYSPK